MDRDEDRVVRVGSVDQEEDRVVRVEELAVRGREWAGLQWFAGTAACAGACGAE